MFLQMGTTAGAPGDASGGAGPTDTLRAPERGVRLLLPRASSLNENVDHSALLKLGTSVSERVSRFDSGARALRAARAAATPAVPVARDAEAVRTEVRGGRGGDKERCGAAAAEAGARWPAGPEAGRRGALQRQYRGAGQAGRRRAVSPTVSQLSAVFEKADSRTGLHRGPGLPRAAAAGIPQVNSKLVSKRPGCFSRPCRRPPRRGCPSREGARPRRAAAPAAPSGSRPAAPAPEVRKIKPVEVEESGGAGGRGSAQHGGDPGGGDSPRGPGEWQRLGNHR